jgi:endonuclease I
LFLHHLIQYQVSSIRNLFLSVEGRRFFFNKKDAAIALIFKVVYLNFDCVNSVHYSTGDQLKKIFYFLLLISNSLYGHLNSSTSKLLFPQITVKTFDSLFIYLNNSSASDIIVRTRKFANNFIVDDTLFSISANDSFKVWVKYSPRQNVVDQGLIVFESHDSTAAFVLLLEGSGKFGDFYDASTFDKYDNELKTALNSLVTGNTSLGYNTARDRMFDTIDKQPGDTIECVYTGIKIKAANRTQAQSLGFDTEHTWPQGTFSQNEPMRSDIFHLYPTSTNANNTRGSFPFGKVVSNITWQQGGSKLGNDSQGSIVFEPRDVHKGDVARSLFYFIIRYSTNYGNYLGIAQEQTLREWNRFDTSSVREKNRNASIASYQLKRNPFIDHNELVDRIFSFTTSNTQPTNPKLTAYPYYLLFDSTSVGDSTKMILSVVNYGDKLLSLNNISSTLPEFSIKNFPSQIPKYEKANVDVWFKPSNNLSFSGQLTLQSNGGNYSINLKGTGKNPTSVPEWDNVVNEFQLFQNYPNPFNPSTRIQYQVSSNSHVSLKIYDVLGNEVATLVDEYKPSGSYEVEFQSSVKGLQLASGIYYYQLRAGNFVQTKKMILLR